MPQTLGMDITTNTSNTTLCLACSASLPPHHAHSSDASSSHPESDIFFTPCCNRPICPSCTASNPRLRRYNPCLHCLGGVGVVRSRSSPSLLRPHSGTHDPAPPQNIDGGVHDSDVYVVGDEDEDESDGDVPIHRPEPTTQAESLTESAPESETGLSTPSPPYTAKSPSESLAVTPKTIHSTTNSDESEALAQKSPQVAAPVKYYIKPGDTLVGISLKYGIDGYVLCRMNRLPPSTLRTTPHLLHTRTFLTLPPTPEALSASTLEADDHPPDAAYEARRAREKAAKRLQTLTKEVDWRVAKAYVAFAEHGEDENENVGEMLDVKQPEKKVVARDPFTGAESSLEVRAIDRYMDDDVWEAQELGAGRGVSIPRFPLFESQSVGTTSAPRSWWRIR